MVHKTMLMLIMQCTMMVFKKAHLTQDCAFKPFAYKRIAIGILMLIVLNLIFCVNTYCQNSLYPSPTLSATVNGNPSFKSCDADAHLILSWLNFYGTSGKDIFGFNFT